MPAACPAPGMAPPTCPVPGICPVPGMGPTCPTVPEVLAPVVGVCPVPVPRVCPEVCPVPGIGAWGVPEVGGTVAGVTGACWGGGGG